MQNNEQVATMIFQIQIQQDVFKRLRDTCFQKCVGGFRESDLTGGETVCVERCVAKFMHAYEIIGARVFASVEQLQPGRTAGPSLPTPR
jgi:mitochondrial import inner membrane translocase subunit TIM10